MVTKSRPKLSHQKRCPKKNGKGTTPKEDLRKELAQLTISNARRYRLLYRSRSRPPLVRKKHQYIIQEVQSPIEMDIPLEILDQTLLVSVGDIVIGKVNAFTVCPMIIPPTINQYWYCTTMKISIFPGDIVYGKHTKDGWIRTVSIQAIPSCV